MFRILENEEFRIFIFNSLLGVICSFGFILLVSMFVRLACMGFMFSGVRVFWGRFLVICEVFVYGVMIVGFGFS